jgi:cytosine/adenosine deaminase-related metal-dependent hydrolase
MSKYSIVSKCFITPDEVRSAGALNIDKDRIAGWSAKPASKSVIDLSHLVVAPALVDAHDHLFGNYYPKIGRGDGKYLNWLGWDMDLKSSSVYKERSKISPLDIYSLACYKHILSGCLTVNDHMPHKVNEPFLDKMPIRIQKDYCLAHEASSYDLRWGSGIVFEHTRAVKEDLPFITHIEEGFDEEAKKGIDILLLLGALSDHTTMIHGIALSPKDIDAIAKARASMVWCPGSNWFMFRKTGDVKRWLAKGVNVALGTDSPASGELNMLYEARWAKKLFRQIYGSEIPDKTLVKMITINAAKALHLDHLVGSLDKGKAADIIAFRGDTKNPHGALIQSSFNDMALVIHNGQPLYGDASFEDLFRSFGVAYRKISVAGSKKIINGSPDELLKRIRKNVGFKKIIPFLPIDA